MCTKVGYTSAAQAQQSIRVLRRRSLKKDRAVNAYRCPECRATWHIGHRY